jgi:hypothetical protein
MRTGGAAPYRPVTRPSPAGPATDPPSAGALAGPRAARRDRQQPQDAGAQAAAGRQLTALVRAGSRPMNPSHRLRVGAR